MKPFKIGVMADSFRVPFEEAIAKAQELGADGVQLYATQGELAPENLPAGKRVEIRRRIEDAGLEISALCGDLGGHGFSCREENHVRIERSKRIVDLARDLGTSVVTTHIGVVPQDMGSDQYRIMQQACGELAAYAATMGVQFAVETGPEPAQTLYQFLESIPSKGIAVNLDPANLVMVTGENPVEAVHILKPYIVHTHAKDGIMLKKTDPRIIYDFFAAGGIGDLRLNDYFAELPLGQGQVDFPLYLQALQNCGYRGYLTIEREVGDTPFLDIKLAVDFLKSLF